MTKKLLERAGFDLGTYGLQKEHSAIALSPYINVYEKKFQPILDNVLRGLIMLIKWIEF